MVGLLAIPCGRTVHSYHEAGPELLMGVIENAKHLQFQGWKGMEKKQSVMSIANRGLLAGMAEMWAAAFGEGPRLTWLY